MLWHLLPTADLPSSLCPSTRSIFILSRKASEVLGQRVLCMQKAPSSSPGKASQVDVDVGPWKPLPV